MKYIVLLTLFLTTGEVQASWSRFAHVTPETQKEYKLDIEFSPIANRENIYRVRFNAISSKHKQAWLIIAADPLTKEEQKLRNYIWKTISPEKHILVKALLKLVKNNNSPPYYEVELNSEILKRSYIYIDFPFRVADGGYYYSIDLSSFLEKH